MKHLLLTFSYTFILSLKLYSQTTYVFFGSFNRDTATDGIYVYTLDTHTGVLSKVSANNSVVNPSYLTLSPDGKYLYACTESQTKNSGSVSSYQFDPREGTLKYLNTEKSGGENPAYLTVNKSGKWLVNANFTGGSIAVYPLSEDGKIAPSVQILKFTEGSIHPQRQDRSHIHAVVFSPEQNTLFCPDLGADKIRSFNFDPSQPLPLQAESFVKTLPGSGPRHLAFHPNGKFAYCIEELSGTVSAYIYKNGLLENVQRVFTHPKNYKGAILSADIQVSPDGKFLYTSNRGDQNNIAIFSVRKNGRLKFRGYQSSLGEHPRIFALDPTGRFLIVTNQVSGNAFVFKRNKKTGALESTGSGVEIRNVSFVKIRQY